MKIKLPYDGSRHARRAVEFIAARSPLAGRDPTIWLLNVQPPRLTEIPLASTRQRVGELYARRADGVLRPARTAPISPACPACASRAWRATRRST